MQICTLWQVRWSSIELFESRSPRRRYAILLADCSLPMKSCMRMLSLHVNPCAVLLAFVLYCINRCIDVMVALLCRQRLDGLTSCRLCLLCHRQHRAFPSFTTSSFDAGSVGLTSSVPAMQIARSCIVLYFLNMFAPGSSLRSLVIPVCSELNPVDLRLSSRLALRVSSDTKCGRDKPVSFCCSPVHGSIVFGLCLICRRLGLRTAGGPQALLVSCIAAGWLVVLSGTPRRPGAGPLAGPAISVYALLCEAERDGTHGRSRCGCYPPLRFRSLTFISPSHVAMWWNQRRGKGWFDTTRSPAARAIGIPARLAPNKVD